MNPDPRPTSTQAAFSGQQQPTAPRDPRRGRIVLPFDPQPVDLGTWTYEHKVGLCVMIIAYLVLGIIFVTTKLVVGGAPPDQHTIYLDMVPPPPEQKQELTPEERRQMEADLSNAHNAISNEDARNEASRQNERTSGAGSGGSQGSSNGSPIPDNIADEADAVAADNAALRDQIEAYGGYYCYLAVPCQYAYYEDAYPAYLENRAAYTAAERAGHRLCGHGRDL